MSDDVETRAATPVEKLEAVHRELRKNSIFFFIGWLLFCIGLTNLGMGYGLWFKISSGFSAQFLSVLFGDDLGAIFMRVGWGIIGLPKIIAMLFGGFGSALKGPLVDYEVVTTYGNGRVVSDGGAQSMQTNIIIKLILIVVLYVLGGVITILHIIILSFKYMGLRTKARPILKPTGLVIMILNVAVLLGAFVVGGAISTSKQSADKIASGVKQNSNLEYKKFDWKDSILITGYKGIKGGDIVIPSEIEGMPVVEIDGYVFLGKTNITSVVIPDSVNTIGSSAFRRCKNLKHVTLPKSLSFGSDAFDGCSSLDEASRKAIRDAGYTGDF